MYVIAPPTSSSVKGTSKISSVISIQGKPFELWFEVTGADKLAFGKGANVFVAACLLPAMKAGIDITVEAPMSAKLYYNLTHSVIPLLRTFCPGLKPIRIHAAKLVSEGTPKAGVFTGFSGGIDSSCAYYDHSGDRAPKEYRVTHFVFNNVGSHGQSAHDEALFKERFGRLHAFCEAVKIPFLAVNSNLDALVQMNFQLTHTLRNACVALLLEENFGKFVYASAYEFKDISTKPTDDMAYLDPILLPLLGTEKIECISSGSEHSRVNKTRLVCEVPQSREYLDVCVQPSKVRKGEINCSYCWKCARTLMTMDALGQLDSYAPVFNPALYRRYRNLYLVEILNTRSPLLVEIRELLRETGFKVPGCVRLLARATPQFISDKISKRYIPKFVERPAMLKLLNRFL